MAHFNAFTRSAPGIGGLTVAQRAAAVPRPGVLNMKSGNITADTAAGFTLAELECGWDTAEAVQGTYDGSYLAGRASMAATLKADGYQVAVSAGIFNTPSWVLSLANGQYKDQSGASSGTPNFVWNPAVRSAAAAYISQVAAAMVTAGVNVDYYRIGIAPSGETFLPANGNSWWAFDALAQGSAGGLPSGISACPYPGWHPGTTTGGTLTTLQATAWWQWYMGAVNNAHQWEIDAHRAGGWSGTAMLVVPGLGCSPTIITQRLAASPPLAASPADYTMNQAAAWHLMIPALASPSNMVVDISSVLDGSGVSYTGTGGSDPSGANNRTQPGDDALSVASADFYSTHWSATRWISYLARRSGLKCVGENPGDVPTGPSPYTQSLASQAGPAMTQAQACGLYGIMWAADDFMAEGNSMGHGYATPAQVMTAFHAVF